MDISRGRVETPFELAASWLVGLNIAIALAGYPLAGVLAAALDVQSSVTSYPFRAASVASVGLMAAMVAFRGTFTLDPLLLLFFAAYGLRLFFDTNYGGFPDAAFSSVFYLVTVVTPFIGISIARGYFNERRAVIAMLAVCTPTLAYLCLAGLENVASSRLADTGRLGFDSLNAVSVGYVALYGLIAAAFGLVYFRPFIRVAFLFPFMAAAFVVLLLASARGAVMAGALCLLAAFLRSGRVMMIGSISLTAIYLVFAERIAELPLIARILSTGSDVSSLERFDRIRSSYEFMIDNPILGYAYIETNYYSFPHNLLLESGLALGLPGLIVMAILQFRFMRLIWAAMRSETGRFAGVLGIVGMFAAWTSTTLWGSVTFWIPLILLISLASHKRQELRSWLLRRRMRDVQLASRSMGPALLPSARTLQVPARRQGDAIMQGVTQTD